MKRQSSGKCGEKVASSLPFARLAQKIIKHFKHFVFWLFFTLFPSSHSVRRRFLWVTQLHRGKKHRSQLFHCGSAHSEVAARLLSLHNKHTWLLWIRDRLSPAPLCFKILVVVKVALLLVSQLLSASDYRGK